MIESTDEADFDLSLIGAPGEAEEWWHPLSQQQMVDAVMVRRRWSTAVRERIRQRDALTALGYELVERGRGVLAAGILPTYTETWIGDLGTITVQWNHDPTDPSV